MTTPQRWALLLRGVNVGGVKLRSADLQMRLAGAGFEAVRTVLASGNALVTAAGTEQDVAERAEAAVSGPQGRTVPVLARRQVDLVDVVAGCPFDADSRTHHAYAVFAASPSDAELLAQVTTAALGHSGDLAEEVVVGDRVLYWLCPREASLTTPVAKAVERAARQVRTTTRNVRTVRRLLSG